GDRALDLLDRLHLARGRTAQIGTGRLGEQPHPHLPDGLRRPRLEFGFELLRLRHPQAGAPGRADRPRRVLVGTDDTVAVVHDRAALVGLPHASVRGCDGRIDRDVAREVPRAVEPQVHAQPELVIELEEHLLADGLRLHDLMPVEFGRSRREAALRRAHRDGRSGEVRLELPRDPVNGVTLGHRYSMWCPTMRPVVSYSASCAIRRTWRSSPENGVWMKRSMNAIASSTVCWRAPIEMTFASLCSRASSAVERFQTSAARTPSTLFAAICSPLPDPPNTTPSASTPLRWSRTTA